MINLVEYAKIKDKYCLCYFGPNQEYLLQLKLLKPHIEKNLKGVNLSFGCRDEYAHIFEGQTDIMKISEIKIKRQNYAYVGEIKHDANIHPVLQLLESCDIKNFAIPTKQIKDKTCKCVIVTKGNYPTQNLNDQQIEILKKVAKEERFEYEIDTDIKNASLVMGVESYKLFEAAYCGADVRLVPTGIGTEFYRRCYPDIKIINI